MSVVPDHSQFGSTYLSAFLKPLLPWLEDKDVSEVMLNQSGEIWVERSGAQSMEQHIVPQLDETALERLVQQIARINHQGISREFPLLSATLGNNIRVQVIAPPATRKGIALALRKNTLSNVTIDDLAKNMSLASKQDDDETEIMQNFAARDDLAALMRFAVQKKKTVLLSGGTSTGKTTFLNALIKEIDPNERIIVIEDTAELQLDQPNALGLTAVSVDQGEAQVTIDDLMRASLRMRPDRLIVGELRGPEVVTFLRAINTGHPGSFASIHASNAQGALEQIALMCLQAKLGLSRSEAIAYASSVIDIIIHLGRDNGRRIIQEIKFLD